MNLGTYGEDLAVKYLCRKGYEILQRNYRCRAGEIDIIAKDHAEPAFIIIFEIKTRSSLAFGLPGEAVTKTKRQRIRRAAMSYALSHGLWARDFRIDVIEILVVGEKPYIKHIKHAF